MRGEKEDELYHRPALLALDALIILEEKVSVRELKNITILAIKAFLSLVHWTASHQHSNRLLRHGGLLLPWYPPEQRKRSSEVRFVSKGQIDLIEGGKLQQRKKV